MKFQHTFGTTAAAMAAALMLNLSMVGCVSDAGTGEPEGAALRTGATATRQATVNLGKAGDYVILSKTGISTTGSTKVTGDIGVSPAAASYITGFSLTAPPSSYSTSVLVVGKVYAADYASPTPAKLTSSVLDMQAAYTDAAGRAPNFTELGTGNIGGMTLLPGVYKWSTNVLVPANVTLSGSSTDVWIFEIAGNLTLASGVRVTLAGGALAKNIFWQVAGIADLGTTSHLEGNVLSKTAIVLKTGASANGRLLAQTAVTLDANAVKKPAP
jgi:ice-binding like protein